MYCGAASQRTQRLAHNRVPKRATFLLSLLATLCVACGGGARTGIVIDVTGKPVAGIAVRLISVNDLGKELAEVAVTLTDDEGRFNFETANSPNASLIVVAALSSGNLRGFYAGSTGDIPIHPLTEGLVSLVVDITASDGGRSTSDFTAKELRPITDAAFDIDTDDIDLADTEAVRQILRDNVGRDIALAAGGGFDAITTAQLEGNQSTGTATFAPDTNVCQIGASIFVLDSDDFRFDIEEDGTLCGGSSTDLDPIFADPSLQLILPGEEFLTFGSDTFPSAAGGSAPLEDNREVVLGPYPVKIPVQDPPVADTLQVTRKVYAPVSGDFIRYYDLFENTGGSGRDFDAEVTTTLTTGNNSELLTFDSAAFQGTPDKKDRYVVAFDDFLNAPTVGFLYQDGLATEKLNKLFVPGAAGGAADQIAFGWHSVHLGGGKRIAFVYYALLSKSRDAEDLDAAMQSLLSNPDMTGLSIDELAALGNFTPSRGTVTGEAGSVIGQALVTAVNERTGNQKSFKARNDGSFAIPLKTLSGDEITLTASDGLATSIIVP